VKVFRKRKMMEALPDYVALMADRMVWPIECDGTSAELLRELGFGIRDEWCEEVDDEI
jgi:hypothetical protein